MINDRIINWLADKPEATLSLVVREGDLQVKLSASAGRDVVEYGTHHRLDEMGISSIDGLFDLLDALYGQLRRDTQREERNPEHWRKRTGPPFVKAVAVDPEADGVKYLVTEYDAKGQIILKQWMPISRFEELYAGMILSTEGGPLAKWVTHMVTIDDEQKTITVRPGRL